MKSTYLVIIFSIFLYEVYLDDTSCNDNGGSCVPYYLCRTNGTVITDGEGIIDVRLRPVCDEILDICCQLNDKKTSNTTILTTTVATIEPKRSDRKCGNHNRDGVGPRIATGLNTSTEFGEFPWMIGILNENGRYRCGGSLIHPSVVLTAAHCIQNITKTYTIRAGDWDSGSTAEFKKHQDRTTASIKIHENYNPYNFQNDIALLFLSSPVNLQPHIDVVCLPPSKTVDDVSICFATGWGKDRFGIEGKFLPILKKVELPMVPKNTCQDMFRKSRLGPFYNLHDSFVCAGGEKGKDACTGDGGGPLVCPILGVDEDDKYQQIGIVSWGLECSNENTPGGYTNVAYFRKWIDKQMQAKNLDTKWYQY